MGLAVHPGSARIASRAAAQEYVARACFTLRPPRLIGAELEWLTHRTAGGRPGLADFAAALGPHAPTTVDPASPALALPGGSAVTVEPGGQVELSSAPATSAGRVCESLESDARHLRGMLARAGVAIGDAAADADRPATRILPAPRYRAMQHRFDRLGPYGRLMMCNTAATQVSVDAGGDTVEVAARWAALHAIGPALLAAFACSPRLHGIPFGSWASQRMRTWFELDAGRTGPPPTANPVREYPRWALDAPLLCVRGGRGGCPDDWSLPGDIRFSDWLAGDADPVIGRPPTLADLDYHLSTLFPPVRATGHLEVRYLDAQPGSLWRVPIAAVAALLGDPAAVAAATAVAAPTVGRWRDAARHGLRDPDIRSTATELLFLAASVSDGFGADLDRAADRCRRGRTVAQESDR